MNIIYISQHFVMPVDNCGGRNFEFAKRWAQKGHNVTMLTSTARLNLSNVSVSGRFFKRFEIGGVKIIACDVAYQQEMGALRRCVSFALFAVLSSIVILFYKKGDIVYASSTPLTVGIPALAAKWFRRIPYIFEVRDQWPESVIQVGILKNRFLIKFLSGFERLIYKHAVAIVALSEPMAEDIRKAAPDSKPIYSITNCCDLEIVSPHVDGSAIRTKYGWENKFIFLHAGSMGKVNNLEFVINAAEKLRDYDKIHFVLIGRGIQKTLLEKRVRELNLYNVSILSYVPKKHLPEFLAAADVIIPIIGNYPIIEKHASLNKFFDGLSAGKPILLNYSGWQRKLIEENNAGAGCQLCNLEEFVDKVLSFYNNQDKLKEMRKNSRKIAEEKFSRDKMAAEALDVIISHSKNEN